METVKKIKIKSSTMFSISPCKNFKGQLFSFEKIKTTTKKNIFSYMYYHFCNQKSTGSSLTFAIKAGTYNAVSIGF